MWTYYLIWTNQTLFYWVVQNNFIPEESSATLIRIKFSTSMIPEWCFQPVIGAFGLLGNILTITVLSTKEMTNSFNKLILALSVFDSIFIIFVTFEYTLVRGTQNIISEKQLSVCPIVSLSVSLSITCSIKKSWIKVVFNINIMYNLKIVKPTKPNENFIKILYIENENYRIFLQFGPGQWLRTVWSMWSSSPRSGNVDREPNITSYYYHIYIYLLIFCWLVHS